MKDCNYINIAGWMGNRLGLRGNELICFAVIYGFSQDGESQFKGNLNYLTECMFCTQPTALLCIDKLLKLELIRKETAIVDGRKRCYYSAAVTFENGELVILGQDSTKETLPMTTKESLVMTTKETLVNIKYIDNNNIDNNKRLSNDNPKGADDGLDFETSFYKLYPLKKAKQVAQRVWNKLSAKDKRDAIDKLPAYIADCALNKRSFKHPATYLNQRTWEDDFGVRTKISFYDALETDSEEKKRFKSWMRKTHPEIENTALPLSYEDYMMLYKEYGTCAIDAALAYIEKDIYMYRNSDIAKVLRTKLTDEEDE